MSKQIGELKPCPFCGLPMTIYETPDEVSGYSVAHAEPFTCPVAVRIHTDWGIEKAIQVWNTRADTAEREAFEAAREGMVFNLHDPNGERADREENQPYHLQTIGFAAGYRKKYASYDDYKARKE